MAKYDDSPVEVDKDTISSAEDNNIDGGRQGLGGFERVDEAVSRSSSPDSVPVDDALLTPSSSASSRVHQPTDDGCWLDVLASLPTCYILLGLLVPLLALHWWLSRSRRRGVAGGVVLRGSPRALVIVAHPDDECMFFSPTIQGLKLQGFKIRLLCLSRGDYYSQGNVREKELYKSCAILGIEQGGCSILNHSSFPDNPNKDWDASLLSQIIHSHIISTQADVVLTFDEYGVSGHSNHRAIYSAINHLIHPLDRRVHLPKNVSVYVLESTSVVRKYTGLLDVVLSWCRGDVLYVAGYLGIFRGWRAMRAHWSQLKWFRLLYIFFSRYMYINTLRKIRHGAL